MKLWRVICLLLIVLGLAGCSAHSPFIVSSTTDVNQNGATKYPPHEDRVFVTEGSLPATTEYEVLATLEVGKVWYGSSDNVLQSLADGAREIGADVVMDVTTWHQPSGWSWAAPHGSGKAVKLNDASSVDLSNVEGDWK